MFAVRARFVLPRRISLRNLTTIHGGKRILVAVDGSVHAKAAFEHAINYVDPKKDELFIMTIPPVVFSNDEFMGTQLNVMIQEKIEEKVQKTREHYEALARDVPVKYTFIVGDPIEGPKREIVRHCREQQIDLAVLGSRGMGALQSAMVGSVVDYVVHHIPCDVLVVKRGEREIEAESA